MASGFTSRRSTLRCMHGAAASSQPLASEIGLRILREGGNAADAAVAMAAALNVTEPCSTGIGGDCFCLFYDAKTKKVSGLNGSGRTPKTLDISVLRAQGVKGAEMDHASPHSVSVPGAAAGWADTVATFGTMKLGDLLQPAIELAEKGFPVHEVAAHSWAAGKGLLTTPENPHGVDMLMPSGETPRAGDVMKMPHLANTFKLLAEHGPQGFYKGPVAEAIVECVSKLGGVMTLDDLASHKTTFEDPISTTYHGIDVYEIAPNGQGLTALMALNMLNGFHPEKLEHNSSEYLHLLIETLRLSFADTLHYVTDPTHFDVPLAGLLSNAYAKSRAEQIRPSGPAIADPVVGSPADYSDTVYFSVVDAEGNACSFINSNYMGFGTGLVPRGCGFTLQNRAAKMPLDSSHPNHLAGGKRPYHTIIPGMAVHKASGELYASFGVMGGYMQPQGHVQVLLNMIDFGMTPQQALDAPRFCIGPGHTGTAGDIQIEDGVPDEVIEELRTLGHKISKASPVRESARSVFGRGQIITHRICPESPSGQVLAAGSDSRGDGCAMGW